MTKNDNIYVQAWKSSPVAIVTLDDEGAVDFCNPAAELIFARTSDALHGMHLGELAHVMDRGAVAQMLIDAAEGNRPRRQEIRFLRPDGSDVVTGFNVSPATDGASRRVCILRDLTNEKALRPQMLHTQRMASMGTVASIVAHELNNALAGALGCLQLMNDHQDAQVRDAVKTASREITRAGEIVRDLKQFARNEEGMSHRIALADVAERASRLYRFHPSAARHDVQVSVTVSPNNPCVRGNENQLMQAVLNLLRNAGDEVASQPPERRTIELAAHASDGVVVIEVADRGRGIPASERAQIFEPFVSSKVAGEGTGLGLAVVQAVVVGHGGRIEIEDTEGGGATFRITLPAFVGDAPAPAVEEVHPSLDALFGARVLVADDEPVVQAVVHRACKKHGALVSTASDAGEAIKLLDERAFELVILDVRMPGGGGAAVFQHILAHHAALASRTVFMSGELSPALSQFLGSGYSAIVEKPFRLDRFIHTLANTLTPR